MTVAPVRLVWQRREPPLSAHAVVARGGAVAALAMATARRLEAGAGLRASARPGWLLVLGEPVDLPWADNVTYLGWDGGLLMPTTSACHPSADLVRAALLPRLPQHRDLIVLLDGDVLATAPLVRLADPAKLRAMR